MKKIIYFMAGTFILIYMLQFLDTKYKNKSYKYNIFNKIKIPLLASAIVGLTTQYICDPNISSTITQDIFTEIPNF